MSSAERQYSQYAYSIQQQIDALEKEKKIREREREIEDKKSAGLGVSRAMQASTMIDKISGMYDKYQGSLVKKSGLMNKNYIVKSADGLEKSYKVNLFTPKVKDTAGKWYPGKNIKEGVEGTFTQAKNRVQVNPEFLDLMKSDKYIIQNHLGEDITMDMLKSELGESLSGVGIDVEKYDVNDILEAMSTKNNFQDEIISRQAKSGMKSYEDFISNKPQVRDEAYTEAMGELWDKYDVDSPFEKVSMPSDPTPEGLWDDYIPEIIDEKVVAETRAGISNIPEMDILGVTPELEKTTGGIDRAKMFDDPTPKDLHKDWSPFPDEPPPTKPQTPITEEWGIGDAEFDKSIISKTKNKFKLLNKDAFTKGALGDVYNPFKAGKSLGGKLGSGMSLLKAGSQAYELIDEWDESSLDEKIQQGLSALTPWMMSAGPLGWAGAGLVELWGMQYDD